jgi:repressor LexA
VTERLDLSPRQREALDFIARQVGETGYPPTRSELADALGVRSANAAELHLQALARKGYIELVPGASRGIRLLVQQADSREIKADNRATGLPLIGRVAAGAPLLAVEHVEDRVAIDPALFHPRPDYLLRVEGESMRDAGILSGDLLLVHATPEARNGQVVVARIDDEVTVKRYFRHEREVTLAAENPAFSPLVIDPAERSFAIEGLAVGILRTRSL